MELTNGNRVIVLVDMDCFYVQVEQKLCPEYQNKPCSVVQYQTWQGGGIIAVNYEARAFGVKRGMRGDEAKKLCPEIHNFRVPAIREKADLTRYREAGASVIDVLCEFSDCVERASIDEAYLDLTATVTERLKKNDFQVCAAQLPNTYIVGWDKDGEGDDVQGWLDNTQDDHMHNDKMLAIAAVIVEELRAAVFNKTMYKCSAGIAHNKMLAKLACGLHKPNKQTVMPHASVPCLYSSLPLHKVRNLGGKFGNEVKDKLNISTMGDLAKFTEAQFQSKFGEKNGSWLYHISRGIDHEPVTARQLPKSVGCGKNFTGKNQLDTRDKVSYWLFQLASELDERLQKDQLDNRRFARSLTVSVRSKSDSNFNMVSRTCAIHVYNAQKIANDALKLIQKLNIAAPTSLLWKPPVVNLTLAASKFEDQLSLISHDIHSYFVTAESTNEPSETNDSSLNHVIDLISDDKKNDIRQNKKVKTMHSYFMKNNADLKTRKYDTCKDKNDNSKLYEPSDSISDVSENVNIPANVSLSNKDDCNQDKILRGKKSLESFFTKRINKSPCDTSENVSPKNNSLVLLNKMSDSLDFDVTSVNEPVNKNQCSTFSSIVKSESDNVGLNTSQLSVDLTNTASSSTSNLVSSNELPLELTVTCSKCETRIPVWEEQEHSDYHIAMDVQNDFDKSNKTYPLLNTSKLKDETKKKYSKASKRKNKSPKQTKQNTIDMFMK